jgi:hypothetical protein
VYLKSTKVLLEPHSRQIAENIGEYFKEIFQKQKGFVIMYFGSNDEKGEILPFPFGKQKRFQKQLHNMSFLLFRKNLGSTLKVLQQKLLN